MRKKKKPFIWITTLLCFFILFNVFASTSDSIRGSFLSKIFPIQEKLFISGGMFFKTTEVFRRADSLSEEIEHLRRLNSRLSSKLSRFDTLENENEELRKALGINLAEEEELVFARVVGRDLLSGYLVIKYDKEIEKGMPVITPEGVLIGIVKETQSSYFGTVQLITSSESSIEGKVQNEDEPIGVLRGGSEKELYIDLLPKDKKIKFGDVVVTMPRDEKMKREFYVGQILSIEENDIEAFNQAVIWQGIDYRYLNYLFIVR